MSLHISKTDAASEALRIARDFLDSECAVDVHERYGAGSATPHPHTPKPQHRRVATRFVVVFRPNLDDANKMDGGEAMIAVDIETRQAGWYP